jgi:uncharacterized protein (DUF2236 family)
MLSGYRTATSVKAAVMRTRRQGRWGGASLLRPLLGFQPGRSSATESGGIVGSAPSRCASDAAPGWFAPGSTIWTVNREAILLLGAGRALLLQMAHPQVAAGVAEHSRFAQDPVGRLFRTLDSSYAIVFGDRAAATAAVRRMDAVHRRVRGVLAEPVGRFPAGTPYDATDPLLRLWVHATLVDTSLLVYERFVAPLSARDRVRYYAESRVLAGLLGIPESLIPDSLEAFRGYVAGVLAADVAVGSTARTLVRLIFHPPAAVSLRVVGPLLEFITVGLVPPAVRELYGYRWSRARERALDSLARAVRRALPVIPPAIRFAPAERASGRRLRIGV